MKWPKMFRTIDVIKETERSRNGTKMPGNDAKGYEIMPIQQI